MTAPLPPRPTSPPTEALRSKRAAPLVARQRNIKKAVSPGPAATTHRAVETGSIPMEGKRSRQPTGKMSHGTPPNTAFLPIPSGDRTPTPASPNPAWEEPHVPEEALTEQMHVLEIAAAPGQATSQPPTCALPAGVSWEDAAHDRRAWEQRRDDQAQKQENGDEWPALAADAAPQKPAVAAATHELTPTKRSKAGSRRPSTPDNTSGGGMD